MAEEIRPNLLALKKWPVFCVITFLTGLLAIHLYYFPTFTIEETIKTCSLTSPMVRTLDVRTKDGGNVVAADGTVYTPNTFLVSNGTYYGCPCSTSRPCIRKCCATNEVFSDDRKCVSAATNTSETIKTFTSNLQVYERTWLFQHIRRITVDNNHFTVVPICSNFKSLDGNHLNKRVFLFEDGSVWEKYYNLLIDSSKYCLDMHPEKNNELEIAVCRENEKEINDLVSRLQTHRLIRNIIQALSVVFYFVTFALFAVQPCIRRGYGRWLMCYLAARFLKIIQVINYFDVNLQNPSTCIITAITLQFSELSSQAWAMIIYYQIWTALRPNTVSNLGPVHAHNTKRFVYYSAIAWGVPLAITVMVTLIQEFTDGAGVQHLHCWYNNRAAKTLYIAFPHVISDLIILVLCTDILRRILDYKRVSATLPSNNIRHYNATEIQWSCIYVEVSMVLAVNYLLLSVLMFLDRFHHVPDSIFYTVEAIDTLRGVEIFFIFVFHKSLVLLFQKFTEHSWHFIFQRIQPQRLRELFPAHLLPQVDTGL